MCLPLAIALRKSATMLEGTYMQRLRLPSFHDRMKARCFLPSLQAMQLGLIQGLRTSDTEPLAAGQRVWISAARSPMAPSVERDLVFMCVCIALYIHTSQQEKERKVKGTLLEAAPAPPLRY